MSVTSRGPWTVTGSPGFLERPDVTGASGSPARRRAGLDEPRPAPRGLLLAVLTDTRRATELSLPEWDVLVRAARTAGVLSQLAVRAYESGLVESLPAQVRPHLESARVLAERHRVVVEWEIGRIEHALESLDVPVVLLKGAAYHATGLPTAAGRLTSDVDILVPKSRLIDVEEALVAAGWRLAGLDAADQAYFRRWLHELPPLVHTRRKTLVDVHHAILPATDRLTVDTDLLFAASVAIPGRRSHVLAPADMFLHSAAHLFRNGAWAHGVRDLVDMDAMLRGFGSHKGFWTALLERADRLNLSDPCAAALQTLDKHLGTPMPASARKPTLSRSGWPLGPLRDRLVGRALFPRSVDRLDPGCERARRALAYWPLPRVRVMGTALFWTKRLPRPRAHVGDQDVAVAGAPQPPDEWRVHD